MSDDTPAAGSAEPPADGVPGAEEHAGRFGRIVRRLKVAATVAIEVALDSTPIGPP